MPGIDLVSEDRGRADVAYARGAADRETAESKKTETERRKEIHTTAMDRFKLVAEAENEQRRRELEDLRFARALPSDQWPVEILKARQATIDPKGRAVAERPTLVIDKLDQPITQIVSEATAARLGILIFPKNGKANTDGAEIRQGLIRTIEQESHAQRVRMSALERAVKCGRGYYRIMTKYANDGDFDQDLVVQEILNQGCVYLDPWHVEPDASDGEWAFITDDLPSEEYRRRYKDSRLAGHLASKGSGNGQARDPDSAEDLITMTDLPPDWVGDDSVRIAEYYYVEHGSRWLIEDLTTGSPILLEEGQDPPEGTRRKRRVDVRRVKWCVLNAVEILDEEVVVGPFIPIVPVTGKRHIVDRDVMYHGVVRKAMDACRSYNYMRSAEVESIGLASKAPWLIDPRQIENLEQWWNEANTRNWPYLPYHQFVEGQQFGPPIRNAFEPAIQAITMASARADEDIKSTTGRYNPSLGNTSHQERSGKAIQALQQQGEQSSSNYIENLASVAMPHEAAILLKQMPAVYDRPGRIIRVLGEQPDDEKHIMLGQPSMPGPGGRPMAVPPTQMMPGQPLPPDAKHYTLADDGDYLVQVSVGRAQATQREADIGLLTSLMEATKGAVAPMVMDLYAELLESPMGKRVAERLRSANPALNDKGQVQIPPQIQQQIEQMKQAMAGMQQELQKAQMALQTDQVKAQATVQVKQMEIQADLEIKKMEIASAEKIAGLKVGFDLAKSKEQQASTERIAHEQSIDAHLDRAHDHAHTVATERVRGEEKRKHTALEHGLAAVLPPAPTPILPDPNKTPPGWAHPGPASDYE